MRGYSQLLKSVSDGSAAELIFFYIDASPYRLTNGKTMKSFPTGVVLVDQSDKAEELSFHAVAGAVVHVIGGDMERVEEFSQRIWQYKPSTICMTDGTRTEIIRGATQ